MDIARGLAIIAVVIGHVLRGLYSSRIVNPDVAWAGALDRELYLMHLPVFALATGLLMPRSVDRQGADSYLRSRLWLLLYVYLVWTLIQGGIEVVTSPWKNVPTTWLDVVSLWQPIGHLWFMPLLMLATVIVVGIAPWREGVWHAAGFFVTCLVSLAFWGVDGPVVLTRGLPLIAFFLIGAWVTHGRLLGLLKHRSVSHLTIGAAIGTVVWLAAGWVPWVTPPTFNQPDRTPASVLLGMAGSLGALVGVLAVSALLARTGRAGAFLALAGRLSLQIYLAHIVFTAGTRIILVRLGVHDPALHVALGSLAGVLGALLVERLTRPFPWLFAPPARRARLSDAGGTST